MKLLFSQTLLYTAASLFMATTSVQAQSAQDMTAQLIDGLKKANLSAIATLAAAHADALVSSGKLPLLFTPGTKTLLAPSDAAIGKMGARLSTATPQQIEDIILYHIVNGSISYNSLPSAFDYHIIAPTFMNDTIFTNLPDYDNQKVVISRKDSREPISVSYGHGLTNLSATHDGPTVGNLILQTIDDVMIPPANFSLLAQLEPELQGMSVSFDKMNMTSSVTSSKGLTIFVPTLEAFASLKAKMPTSNATRFKDILKNHYVNGTVVYSVQMPSSIGDNDKAKTSKVTQLSSAGGQPISITFSNSGQLQVTCGDTTANIVKTDRLISNGVVHLIDQVIFNDLYNATAATNTDNQLTTAVPDVAAQSKYVSTAATSAHSPNGASKSLHGPSYTCIAVPAIMALAALVTLI